MMHVVVALHTEHQQRLPDKPSDHHNMLRTWYKENQLSYIIMETKYSITISQAATTA